MSEKAEAIRYLEVLSEQLQQADVVDHGGKRVLLLSEEVAKQILMSLSECIRVLR